MAQGPDISGPDVYGIWAVMGRPRAGHARPLQGGGVFVGQLGKGGKAPQASQARPAPHCVGRLSARAPPARKPPHLWGGGQAQRCPEGLCPFPGVTSPPYSINESHRFIMASIPTKYEQNKCPAAFWGSRAVLYIIGNTAQFPPDGLSTAPTAAARHLRCQNAR